MQRKFNCRIEAPVFNRSGYGDWASAVIPILIEYPHFNVSIASTAWGNCVPRITQKPSDVLIQNHLISQPSQTRPDIGIYFNLPKNTPQPAGRIFNINFSAGLEVDKCPPDYMKAVNRFDLSILTSNFAKQVYLNSEPKPCRAMEVLPWPQDLDVFRPTSAEPQASVEQFMQGVTEQEAFLFVGQRTHPVPEFDRKNSTALVRAYCKAFAGSTVRPALILKVNGTNFSYYDRDASIKLVRLIRHEYDASLPIYLLHGELTDEEFSSLYNHPKIVACLSATRGEGFGGSLLQSSLCGKPTIASNHGGHLDYLPAERATLVDGNLDVIPPQAVSEWFMPGTKWFNIDEAALSKAMSGFYFNDRSKYLSNAAELAKENAYKFSPERVRTKLFAILDKYLFGKHA